MEQLGPPAFNPHLKRVLDTYQNAAVRSLSGPSSYVAGWGDPAKMSPAEMEEFRMKVISTLSGKKAQSDLIVAAVNGKTHEFGPPPFPIQQVPVFMPMDSSRSEKSETILEGETISCFIVGGEKRLCLPQILNTVLRDFSLHQINTVCDDLHIFCSRCNPEQLDNLKMTAVLPLSAPSCGLITKTDAERLCNALLHSSPERSVEPPTPNSFRVYHECFGKCKGIFSPELYTSPHARCIECAECCGMFCPQKFVCHSHNTQENRTCHWGFDSANWRSYLLLSKDQEHKSKHQDILERMKARFDFMSKYKRKESPSPGGSDSKRARYEENKSDNSFDSAAWTEGTYRHVSAFQPWAPSLLTALKEGKTLQLQQQLGDGLSTSLPAYLQTGPPVLLNPERVIPHSESSRYERHFAPNVSLAPQSQQMIRVKEELTDDGEKTECILNNSELNVSSDTDDSSYDNSVPTTPQERWNASLSLSSTEATNMPDCSHELVMLQRALSGEVENQESFITEYLQIRKQYEDRYKSLLKEKRRIQEEVELLQRAKKQHADLKLENEYLRKEIDVMRSDHDRRMAKMKATVESLRKEKDCTINHKSPDVLKNKAKYKAQIADLKARLRRSEQCGSQTMQELEFLQSEWKRLGKELPVIPVRSPVQVAADYCTEQSQQKYKDAVNGKNGSPVISVKEEPKSDSEQSVAS